MEKKSKCKCEEWEYPCECHILDLDCDNCTPSIQSECKCGGGGLHNVHLESCEKYTIFPSQPNSEEKIEYLSENGNLYTATNSKVYKRVGDKWEECHSPKPEDGWKEDLYFEVVEDLIYYSKMFHLAKDQAKQTELIRNQIRKVESFISNLLTKTRQEERERIRNKLQMIVDNRKKTEIYVENITLTDLEVILSE